MKKHIKIVLNVFLILFCTINILFAQETESYNITLQKHDLEKITILKGHNHNDYDQKIPFYTAYNAEMESIEADLFFRNDTLYTAHDAKEIKVGKTLENLYLNPLIKIYKKNKGRPYKDKQKSLQLMLDFKEDYNIIMPALITLLEKYNALIDSTKASNPIKIVISGNMPPPSKFINFPNYIYFDGRFNQNYSEAELKRIALFSDNIKSYSKWRGDKDIDSQEFETISQLAKKAKSLGKELRLWGTSEGIQTWVTLEKMGITWLNTDHPEDLRLFLSQHSKLNIKKSRD